MGASNSTLTPSGSSLTLPETGVAKGTAAKAAKKMSLMQLTFIVAVNMMGSGIIMLPTNMAKVGAISLLSWIVTALRSLPTPATAESVAGGPRLCLPTGPT